MKDPTMRKMFPPRPFFARFWRTGLPTSLLPPPLPFGSTIAYWYAEERTLARARPREV